MLIFVVDSSDKRLDEVQQELNDLLEEDKLEGKMNPNCCLDATNNTSNSFEFTQRGPVIVAG